MPRQPNFQAAFIGVLAMLMQVLPGQTLGDAKGSEYSDRSDAVAISMPPVKERPLIRKIAAAERAFVMNMKFITKDHLLVNYLFNHPVLYDVSKGEIAWRFQPEGKLAPASVLDSRNYDVLAVFSDLILLRQELSKRDQFFIAAIDPRNGKQLWFTEFNSNKREHQFLPVPGAGVLLAIEMEKKRVTTTALDLLRGSERWQKKVKIKKGKHTPPPLVTLSKSWYFYGAINRVNPSDGNEIWERNDVTLDGYSPPPALDGESLIAIDADKTLHILDSEKGTTIARTELNSDIRYTNIYPVGDRIYLRGDKGNTEYIVSSLEKTTGRHLWTYSGHQPTISNFIEDGQRVYVATHSSVLCLDRDNGNLKFSSNAAQTGGTFPVRLRKFGNLIVYIGELVIAGYSASSGKEIYFEGMTPISQEAHLDALDNWMSMLEGRIKKLSGAMWFVGASGASDAWSRQAEISQNLSRQHHSDWSIARSRGDSVGAALSSRRSEQEQAQARRAADMAFFAAMEGLKNSILSRSVAKDRAQVSRLQRIRQSILSAYSAAESREHAWRPHLEGDNVGVTLVHLPSGQASFTPLFPLATGSNKYGLPKTWVNDRALWNLMDLQQGSVYHHGLRILPDKFQDKTSHTDEVNYGIYLVEERIRIPK